MPKRILVVDDEPAIAAVLATLFEDEDYLVEVAVNGADGLDRAGRNVPDLVLLDVMMPVLDGPEMLRRMREDRRFARIPVLLMSAARPPAGCTGHDAFVEKPFEMERLIDLVSELMKRDPTARLS